MHVDQTVIPQKLREMVDMLVDEEAREEGDTPGVCMEYFLKNGLLHYLVNVSEKMDYPQGIRRESIRTIASMVDILDDKFLVHSVVHTPTIKLLKFCVLDERQSALDHEYLVDLMYKICSKIHGVDGLLDIFFHKLTTPQKITPPNDKVDPPPAKVDPPPEYEFLLFTYLLRFVHQDDFARTGLLFLIEMATDKLGEFILTSDFATIVAASLDALYSQLPRKLIIKDEHEINSTPASYLLGQDLDARAFPTDEYGIEHSSSKQFKDQLDSFLKLLEFCQDVLLRCPNDAISERLLQCIRMTFLKNVLYPSILECSDVDGSSVAVMSYTDSILQTVHQQDLATVILSFLMDRSDEEDEELITSKLTITSPTKSTIHHVECDSQSKSTPYVTEVERYTLKELIFSQLKSSSQPTVIATLKLLKTMIVRHCRFADRLLSTIPDVAKTDKEQEPPTIVSHHIREIGMYFTLIHSIDRVHAPDIMSKGYEEYLIDAQSTIECDVCYQDIIQPPYTKHQLNQSTQKPSSSKSEKRRSLKYGQRGIEQQHQPFQSKYCAIHQPRIRQRIQQTDELIQHLLRLLFHFFTQSSELNLALTGVISALAACPYRSLEGWISFCETDRSINSNGVLDLSTAAAATTTTQSNNQSNGMPKLMMTEETEIDDDQSVDFGVERNSIYMTTPTQFNSFPSFYTQFHTLTQQVDYYRSDIDGFDKLLDERWNGLLFGESTPTTALPAPTASSSSLRFFDYPPIVKPSTSSSSSVSKFLGLSSPPSARRQSTATVTRRNSSAMHIRRSSTATTINTSTSTTTTGNSLPNNPSKSLSSSTITSVMVNNSSISVMDSYGSPSQQQEAIVPAINPLSPLGMHANKALSERVTPLFPSNFKIKLDEPILNLDVEDQDVFEVNPKIPLSMVLNNVVILEETIKELVAIMQVRRSLGIDKIRYT